MLLSHGGSFEQVKQVSGSSSSSFSSSAAWQYVGGETRLVAVHRAGHIGDFVQQLSKATAAVWDEVRGGGGGEESILSLGQGRTRGEGMREVLVLGGERPAFWRGALLWEGGC